MRFSEDAAQRHGIDPSVPTAIGSIESDHVGGVHPGTLRECTP
jgi:hypothetical protein